MYLFSFYPEGFKELALAESESFEDYDHFFWNDQPRLNGSKMNSHQIQMKHRTSPQFQESLQYLNALTPN